MKSNLFVVALMAVFLLVGIGSGAAADSLPKAEGQAVYEYLTKVSPYQDWPLFPGTQKLYEGKHPHGALLTTYVSPDAQAAIQNRAGQLPDGTIIVKENYMPDGKLDALTVMYRVKGFNPEAGDWFWAKYGANGNIDAEGKVPMCSGCHTAVIQNDWVFTGPLK
ncbi:cytochrome P460 family protein [Geoalkalibacter sp.]|uniref:cytochrome P460 family protein n=1 Tax=Geoalkalibacter sp. TaxID=3041440 RepID=UPI00272E59B8|nr:cytochrome P460 family protein [Geoalkalibacter sp.]